MDYLQYDKGNRSHLPGVLKTDLDLRPIYHKTDEAAMAHLHLGLLAYWVVNTIRHQLKQKGIKNEWRDLVRGNEHAENGTNNNG